MGMDGWRREPVCVCSSGPETSATAREMGRDRLVGWLGPVHQEAAAMATHALTEYKHAHT